MAVEFSQFPGRYERHYRRRLGNPLFAGDPVALDQEVLLEMQRLDHEELLGFLAELRQAVQRAVDLKPNVGSEVVLELKEQLDRLYEVSAGLADDHGGNQAAIKQLLEVIMRNVERGAAGVEAWVVEFIDDMAEAYAWADLVICRAGALTVSELAAAGVAALLVPYPYAVDDHQTANGNYLARAGAALLIQQRDLGPERLAGELRALDRATLTRMAVTARSLAKPDATARFADICEEVLAA